MRTHCILLFLVALAVNFHNAESDLYGECKKAKVDLLFVLDSSFSIGRYHWNFQTKFVSNLVKPFTIGKNRARIGVITFNTLVYYPIHLSNAMSKKQLLKRIRNLRYTKGLTSMGEALIKARQVIKREGRKKATKMVILITDGKSNGWVPPVPEAKKLKKDKVMIISVGITDAVNKRELKAISTSGNFIQVKKFSHLKGIITKQVQKKSCRSALVSVCKRQKSDLTFILDSSTSIGPDRWSTTLNFVERLLDPLFIGRDSTRVSLMTFNTNPTLQFLFNKYLNKVSLEKKGIAAAAYTEGLTYMGEALRFFRLKMFPFTRRGVSKIVILITDGHANGHLDVMKEVKKLKGSGVDFITVGVTNRINKKQLLKISTGHKLYYASRFSKLKEIVKKVQGEVCLEIRK